MRNILLLLIPFLCLCVNAQTLKTYSGQYNCLIQPNTDSYGKATYTYYEKNDKRMYHDQFTYSDSRGSLKGKFKDNKQDGLWTFTEKINFTVNRSYYNGKLLITITYKDGVPNGPITFSMIDSKTNSTKATFKANFENGKLVGNVGGRFNKRFFGFYGLNSFESLFENNVSGKFDENGLPIDDWTVSGPTCKVTETYGSDGNYSLKEINPSTGDIVESYRDPKMPNLVIEIVNYALRQTLMRDSNKFQLPYFNCRYGRPLSLDYPNNENIQYLD